MEDLQELLDIVDENDNVIGQDTKENKFQKNLITRNVAVFLINSNCKMLIVKRSPFKKIFPNMYDVAACGNVMTQESYEDAAKRESFEELGVKCELNFITKIFNDFKENDPKIRFFTAIFIGKFFGNVKLNGELVESKVLSLEDIDQMINTNKNQFTPGFINDYSAIRKQI